MGTVGHCPHRSLFPSLLESWQGGTWELLDTVLTEACCHIYRSQGRYVHGNYWTLPSPKLVAKSTGVKAGRYLGTIGHCPRGSLMSSLLESGQVSTRENCWPLSSPKLVAISIGVRAGRYMGTVGHCPHRSLLPSLPESGQVGT